MSTGDPGMTSPVNTDLTEVVEEYKRTHPQVDEAMKIFDISNEAYQGAVDALYGPRVSWTHDANEAPRSSTTQS